jgi:hypothetical protein
MDAVLSLLAVAFLVALVCVIIVSFRQIGPTEVGLVRKRFGPKLPGDNPVAFAGEAGYQAELLMPGLRFKFLPVYAVRKYPWVQVPAGQIGVVIAQVGTPTPIGAKSAIYRREFANFTDLNAFVRGGGQKGVQRPVLSPGTLAPIHPVAFLVITKPHVYGEPVTEELRPTKGGLTFQSFGLTAEQLDVTRIEPKATESGRVLDMEGSRAQNEAIGQTGTMLVNVASVLADKSVKIVPDILVTGGGGALDALAAAFTRTLTTKPSPVAAPAAPAEV